jgi:hypothetical protein
VAQKRHRLDRVFDAIGLFYPDYTNMILDSKKMKRKVTMKQSKVLKILAESTPQGSYEIMVQRIF